jgi:hypothetical protein
MDSLTSKLFSRAQLLAMLTGLLCFTSITTQASMFSFVGGDNGVLPANWNPSDASAISQNIIVFDGVNEGVRLDQSADLVYTYIGKEAGSTNSFGASGNAFFSDDFFDKPRTAHNSAFEVLDAAAGFLDFNFMGLGTCCTAAGEWVNGAGNFGSNNRLSLAVAVLSPSSLYLMFGDGWGDNDFDDMVVRVDATAASVVVFPPSQVPVPAAIWLFGTALVGLVGLGRRRKVT